MKNQNSNESEIQKLREVVKKLRSPNGCPWDKKQTHSSLRYNAVEEAYELVDAIEQNNDDELIEELGDLLLQVVLHSQIAEERKAFDFDLVCKKIREKLISRHPHVFGDSNVQTVDGVWSQWERLKLSEKKGTLSERHSVFDGIPKYLPALIYAEKVLKKSNRIGISLKLVDDDEFKDKQELAMMLFSLVQIAHSKGWSAEALLRSEIKKIEKKLRKIESQTALKKSESKSVKKTKD